MKVKYVIIGACLVTLFLNACKKQSIEELPTTMCNIVEPIDTIPQYNHWSDTCPPNVHALACSLEYRLGTWVEVLDSIQGKFRHPDTLTFLTDNTISFKGGGNTAAGLDTTYVRQYYFQWSIWRYQHWSQSFPPSWVQVNTSFDKEKEHWIWNISYNPDVEYRMYKLE